MYGSHATLQLAATLVVQARKTMTLCNNQGLACHAEVGCWISLLQACMLDCFLFTCSLLFLVQAWQTALPETCVSLHRE